MKRRLLLGSLMGLGFGMGPADLRAEAAALLSALRGGGVVLMLRHARTVPGVGDPPDFRLGDCATQRNLSAAGRAQARRIGQTLAAHGLQPRLVRSSGWCRCIETAELAFGRHEVWPALHSFFTEHDAQRRAQTAALHEALAQLPAEGFEAWVSHQVNITALTGSWVDMGEAVVIRGGPDGGTMLGRLRLDA
ncbi:histidine phosphatase family protein [Caldimonas sp.]|uniref:histidine phosphatase family protein n=1 Tax=Caldimonas sp. TaxID=2838790 RepID=UPI0029D8ACE8|nr:histidine phosphatase family protein [Caldimonas manganoxidans]